MQSNDQGVWKAQALAGRLPALLIVAGLVATMATAAPAAVAKKKAGNVDITNPANAAVSVLNSWRLRVVAGKPYRTE